MRFKGVNVGKVTAIGFDPLSPDNVLIQIEIDEQAPITQSTFGTLGFQGVTGLAFVQLDDAGESTVALLPGAASPAHIPMRGTLDQLASGVDTLSATGQVVNAATLPRLNRTVDETARTARQLSRAFLQPQPNHERRYEFSSYPRLSQAGQRPFSYII